MFPHLGFSHEVLSPEKAKGDSNNLFLFFLLGQEPVVVNPLSSNVASYYFDVGLSLF